MPLRNNLVHDGKEGIAFVQPPTNIGKVRTRLPGYGQLWVGLSGHRVILAKPDHQENCWIRKTRSLTLAALSSLSRHGARS